jgi:hypothetical protein
MEDGLVSSSDLSHSDGIHFQYVPMMTAATPVSLSLLDRLADVALGGAAMHAMALGGVAAPLIKRPVPGGNCQPDIIDRFIGRAQFR